jgi:hypothetical protein
MTTPRRFDPREVDGPDSDATAAELAEALAAARSLETSLAEVSSPPSADLAERIMASVRHERSPRAAGILATLRRRPSPAGVVASLGIGWRRATGGGPLGVRATALAYVAAVVLLLGTMSGVAAYTAAGALGWLPGTSHPPDASLPAPTPAPLASPEPTDAEGSEPVESGEPADTEGPTETPEASRRPGATDNGGGGGDGSDDGQTASPGSSSDDHGDGGSGQPSATPRPTGTPKATETPKPTSSSGGSDG